MRARSQVISKQCFSLHVSWIVISFVWGVRIVKKMSLMYSPSARKQFSQGGKQQTSSSHLETFSSTGSSLECSGRGLNCGHQWGQRLGQRGQDLNPLRIKCHDSLLCWELEQIPLKIPFHAHYKFWLNEVTIRSKLKLLSRDP